MDKPTECPNCHSKTIYVPNRLAYMVIGIGLILFLTNYLYPLSLVTMLFIPWGVRESHTATCRACKHRWLTRERRFKN